MNRVYLMMLALLGLTMGGCGVDWFPDQVATPTTAATSGTSGTPVLTVTAFSFAPITNAVVRTLQSSNAITVTLSSGTSASISVSEGGKYKINNGEFTSVAGVVNNKDTVVVQHTAASGDGQRVTTTLTIGNKSATFSSTTANVSVAQFSMTPPAVVNATAGSPQTSTTTVALASGSSAKISVSGGEYKINDGAFTLDNGTVKNNDTVTLQHTTASGTEPTVTTLIIGDKSATFSSTTASAIFSVKDFSFAPLTGVVAAAPQTSEIITIGFNSGASAKISVRDGAYKINDGAFTSADAIVNDTDKVTVQHTAASGDGQEVRTIVTIGDRSAVFSSTTALSAVAPFAFAPASITGVALGSLQTSNAVTVALTSGTSAKISVTQGQYKIGNGAFTSADGVVSKGDLVVVQNTASSTASTSTVAQLVATTLTIGEQSSTFSSTTAAATFIPLLVTNVTAGSTVTSNPMVVVLSSSTPIAISITGGEYSINGGAFTSAAGTVKNNDLVTVRHPAGATTKITVSTFLTIGGKNFPFSSTTI